MEIFTKKVIGVLLEIPKGCIVTYGQVAALAGNPRGARQVARILHSLSAKLELPWHRVVNAKGEIVVSNPERQIALLAAEGVKVDPGGRINLKKFRWEGSAEKDPDWMRG